MTTRKEHIQWVKERALAELDNGSVANAIASFQCDLRKHLETQNHMAIELSMFLAMHGKLSNESKVRRFIEDIN